MAATNPFRVSDLVAKYGWQAMIYLAALGIENLAEAQVLFVNSAHVNALDADDTEHGHSFQKPLATWDYAFSLCTADERSIILLAPTHNEVLADAQVDIDVADVQTIGIGSGLARPTIDFDHANSSINVGANNCSLQNVNLLPSVELILIGVHVETDKTGFRMKDVDFLIGEDGAGVDEFVKAVELTDGNDDTVFEDVKILAHANAGGATHGIHIAAASDRLTLRNVIIDGPYTNGIVEAVAGKNHIVENCAVDTTGTNYGFQGSSTFAKRTNNVDGQVTEDESESLLLTDRGSGVYPTGITNKSILAFLMSKSGTPASSSYDNTAHSLEAIGDLVAGITNQTGVINAVPEPPTAKSLQDILHKDGGFGYLKASHSLEAIGDALATTENEITDILNVTPTAKSLQDALQKDANGTYDRASHSLEAIGDAVAAITFTAAVDQNPTPRSLQDILEKDNSGSFSDATDSLEAIRDHIDGTTVLGGIQLDHLAQTTSAGTNYPTEVTTDSILGMIMAAAGNPNTFNKTTDSLEAIRNQMDTLAAADQVDIDAILVDTNTTIPDTITTMQGNVTDILNDTAAWDTSTKARTILYGSDTPGATAAKQDTAQTDLDTLTGTGGAKLETATQTEVTDILADTVVIGTIVNTAGAANLGAALGDFANSTLVARLDLIDTDTSAIAPAVKRLATRTLTDWAASANNALWDISAPVKAKIWGVVLAQITGVATNLKISSTPTAPGGLVDIVANLDCNADAIGTVYKMNTTLGGAMVEVTGGVTIDDAIEVILPAGVVEMGSGANEAGGGSIQWFIEYEPLVAGAVVTNT